MDNKITNFYTNLSSEDKKFMSYLGIGFIVFIIIITIFINSSSNKKEIINPILKAQELQIKENRLYQEKQNLDTRIIDFYKNEKKPFVEEVQGLIDGISEHKIDTSLLQNIK